MSTGCGCSNEPGGKNQDAGVDGDSSQQDGRVDADAARDGAADGEVDSAVFDAGPVDAFVYHDCMAPMEVEEITAGELYRIPVVEQDFHGGIAWNGQYLVQADYRCPSDLHLSQDLYVIDMETLEEELLVARGWGQTSPSLHDGSFVYTDFGYYRENDPNNDHRAELILHDLVTHEETRLTDSNEPKVWPKFNGTHVVYLADEYTSPTDYYSTLRLLDITTSQETVLATEEQGITSSNIWDINSEYVAWRAVPDGEPNSAWDVFLHHIPTGQTSRLHTPSNLILNVLLSEDKVAWTEQRSSYWSVYAQDLTTMTEQVIASGNSDKILGSIGPVLVNWLDYERSGCEFPCTTYDIIVKDLTTGIERRLTDPPGSWGCNVSACRWAIRTESVSSSVFRLYAWDMVAAGVIDQNCNLIPCDPQTEQCAMLEWQGP
jgi:hypothetical protein